MDTLSNIAVAKENKRLKDNMLPCYTPQSHFRSLLLHIDMFVITTFVSWVKVICKDNMLCNVGLSCYILKKSDKVQF
jgi:hypothetical protein